MDLITPMFCVYASLKLRIKNPRFKPGSGSIKQTKELINCYKEDGKTFQVLDLSSYFYGVD